jgi:hypothetical protein
LYFRYYTQTFFVTRVIINRINKVQWVDFKLENVLVSLHSLKTMGLGSIIVSGDRYSTDCIETIVRLTSINLQKKILKNPVFKSTFIFLDAY